MTLGWPLGLLFEATAKSVEATRVDCGTCPVNLQCIASNGGNGWRYDCCGAAAVEVADGDDGRLLLIMDCQRNAFEQRERASDMKACPLCNGDLTKGHVLGMSDHHRYVPTVHAKVPVKMRLALWHKTMPDALALKRNIDERMKKK